MVDRVSKEIRSKMMASVTGTDTEPELIVRRQLFASGYRYRLHRRDLPGSPDIVFPRDRLAVFVHGCFWHGHHCRRGKRPKSNVEFWNKKLRGNVDRDRRNQKALKLMNWRVFIIWECSLHSGIQKLLRLIGLLKSRARSAI
jgi:DNA mismatch endonuclease (patch repair protein)